MAPELGILANNNAILRLILEQVYDVDPKSLGTFRLVSSFYQKAADPVFYRHLRLRDDYNHSIPSARDDRTQKNPFPDLVTARIIRLILDPVSDLRVHIRHLQIGPFVAHVVPEYYLLPIKSIIDIINTLNNLKDFTWHVCTKIPPVILNALQSRWPHARLHVIRPHRPEPDRERVREQYHDRPTSGNQAMGTGHGRGIIEYEAYQEAQRGEVVSLDKDALSSPQLFTLETAPLCNPGGYTEFGNLTDYICKRRSLKILKLRHLNHFAEEKDIEGYGPLQFRLGNGAVMPNLEEFVIDHCYDSDPVHMRLWAKSMDWSCMKRLEVPAMGPSFFEGIMGLVPQLECLGIGMMGEVWDGHSSTMKGFVESIRRLEEVSFDYEKSDDGSEVWDWVLRKHGASLRRVKTTWAEKGEQRLWVGRQRGWGVKQVQRLLEFAPKLEDLSIELELVKHLDSEHTSYIWPKDALTVLTDFKRLHHIHISIPLQQRNNTPFARFTYHGRNAFLNEQICREPILSFYEEYMRQNPRGPLDTIEVEFWHNIVNSNQRWRYTMQRPYTMSVGEAGYVMKFEKSGKPLSERRHWE